MKLKHVIWAAALALILALSGCSCGDDDDDNDSGGPVTDDTAADDTGADDTVSDDTVADDTTPDDTTDDTVDDDTETTTTTTVPTTTTTTTTTTVVTTSTTTTTTMADDCSVPLDDPDEDGPYTAVSWEYGDASDPDRVMTPIRQYYFTISATVPLHAKGYYPDGAGPFPVVLIVHGNHTPSEASWPGYDYLTYNLATHGIIAVSVEEDFLNGGFGEMDARAIILLRHLQLFRGWQENSSHPLYHKIDMSMIGLSGHSRGGEAVTVAWVFNNSKHDPADPLHDFNFDIRSLFAIAPVDGQIGWPVAPVILKGVHYFIMHGSHDGDVSDFQGAQCYDRAYPVDEDDSVACKGLLFVQGANHSGWNTVWALNPAEYPVEDSNIPQMSAEDQQTIGKDFLSAWFRWTLLGRSCYRLMAAGEVEFPSFPAGYPLNRQYQDPTRYFLDHYQEDTDKATGSATGVTNAGVNLDIWNEGALSPGSSKAVNTAYDTTGATYTVTLTQPVTTDMTMLAFRVGQVYEATDVYNEAYLSQDFSVSLVVGGTPTDALPVSDYRDLVYPCYVDLGWDNSKTILDTVRIPLEDFNGGSPLDTEDVEAIVFSFDVTDSGRFQIDEIQFADY